MEKGQNFNNPKKGSRIEVEPIRREKDIKAIIQLLSGNPRDHLLFVKREARYLKPDQHRLS